MCFEFLVVIFDLEFMSLPFEKHCVCSAFWPNYLSYGQYCNNFTKNRTRNRSFFSYSSFIFLSFFLRPHGVNWSGEAILNFQRNSRPLLRWRDNAALLSNKSSIDFFNNSGTTDHEFTLGMGKKKNSENCFKYVVRDTLSIFGSWLNWQNSITCAALPLYLITGLKSLCDFKMTSPPQSFTGMYDGQSGVPQGFIFGPLLFTLFIAPLLKFRTKCSISSYTVLMTQN